jgi:hypothetical protein
MFEEKKPFLPPNVKPLADKELMEAENSSLTNDQLQRKLMLIDIESRASQAELTRHQTAQFKMKQAEQKDKFWSRGRELKNTAASQKKHQDGCSHRKGGRSIEALQRGGTDASDHSLIRHLLPHNEWFVRCQRCGKTWRPPHVEDFDLKTVEGKAAFEQAKVDYKWAMEAPTNNTPSTGITFKHQSEDDDKTAKQFVHDVMQDVNLR